MSWRGREALPDVQERSEVSPGYPGLAERPSQMSESGREALRNVREWSGDTTKCWEALSNVWE